MITKYVAYVRTIEIVEVDIIRENDQFVFIEGTDEFGYSIRKRVLKSDPERSFHDTFDAAKDYLDRVYRGQYEFMKGEVNILEKKYSESVDQLFKIESALGTVRNL